MDKQSLKRLVEAHSWLGLMVSALLFVIFFAGSVTLFKEEINQWAFQPHYQLSQGQRLPVSEVFAKVMQTKPFDAKSRATLVMPTEHMPYYQLRARFFIDDNAKAEGSQGKTQQSAVFINPATGKIIGHDQQFFLANFIYRLHYQLNTSYGYELIGFVTLFFFFSLVSGIFIHARKLVSQFFRYQPQQDKRRKWLDMHNLIGVMTLPFTVMYAISGLIFNLLIIYQIAFVVVAYQGDEQQLREDSGYFSVSQQLSKRLPERLPEQEQKQEQEQPWQSPDIDGLYQQVVEKYQHQPESIRMYNYGDKNAAIHFRGEEKEAFGQRFEVAYTLSDNKVLFQKDSEHPNAMSRGLAVMAKLHFGNYAGPDLRLIYFLLGLSVCVLIVTGNLLWIDKQARKRNSSAKTVSLVTGFTLLGSVGVVLATVVAFLTERLLPVDLPDRSSFMVYSFVLSLVVTAVYLYFARPDDNNKNQCLSRLLGLSSLLLFTLVLLDWVLLREVIAGLWYQGVKTVLAVDAGLMVIAAILGHSAVRLGSHKVQFAHH